MHTRPFAEKKENVFENGQAAKKAEKFMRIKM